LVIGFRLKDTKAADRQLQRLDQVLERVAVHPLLVGRLKRVKVKGRNFLSLTLDGKMVPWDQIPIQDLEQKEGEYDALIKKVKDFKLTISLGVRDDSLLLALGESFGSLDRLGGRGPKLVDRTEMQALARFQDKPLTSVSYVSRSLRSRLGTKP